MEGVCVCAVGEGGRCCIYEEWALMHVLVIMVFVCLEVNAWYSSLLFILDIIIPTGNVAFSAPFQAKCATC